MIQIFKFFYDFGRSKYIRVLYQRCHPGFNTGTTLGYHTVARRALITQSFDFVVVVVSERNR